MTNIGPDSDSAARWAIRIDAGPLTAGEQAELDNWIGEKPNREGALLRAQAVLSYLDRARALAGVETHDAAPQRRATDRMGRRGFMIGAGLATAAAFTGLLVVPGPSRIETAIGEIRSVPLEDGSVATVNTASRLTVQMAEKQRTVELREGEAWFRVAPDRARPFVVEAGSIRVQAVGTAFSVRRHDTGAEVLVTEGIVETWIEGRETERRRITAGFRGFVSEVRPAIEIAAAPQEIERSLAWRSGELALDGETLAYAVDEINRYNARKLVIADPELGREQLVGYFRTTEPENFGRAVAAMTGARVIIEGQTIRLVKVE